MDIKEKARFIYESNRLDGITLNLDQTRFVVTGSINPMEFDELEAPDGEVYETSVVSSHLDALNFVLGFPKTRPLNEDVVRELHAKLMKDVLVAPGEYREHNPNVPISHKVDFRRVPALMNRFGRMIESGPMDGEDQEIFAWKMHHEICAIYPFVEGNGRTARLLLNLIRARFGLPFELITYDERDTYFRMINDYIRRRSV